MVFELDEKPNTWIALLAFPCLAVAFGLACRPSVYAGALRGAVVDFADTSGPISQLGSATTLGLALTAVTFTVFVWLLLGARSSSTSNKVFRRHAVVAITLASLGTALVAHPLMLLTLVEARESDVGPALLVRRLWTDFCLLLVGVLVLLASVSWFRRHLEDLERTVFLRTPKRHS